MTTPPCRRLFSTGLFALASLGALALAGCSEDGLAFTPPYITASTEVMDFGEQVVGMTDQRSIFLVNKGEVTLTFDAPRYDAVNDVFGAALDGLEVEPNKDVVLAVRFRPAHARTYTTTVTVINNSSNRPELFIVLKGTGISPGPCDGVECRRAPPPTCVSENTTRRYEPIGQCNPGTGVCEHPFRDDACMYGCDDATGACRGDPCVGMSCSVPPNNCYFAQGMCENGACQFEVNNAGQCDDLNNCSTGDHCSEGTCVGLTKTCTAAPASFCLDANTRRVFQPQGACNAANGACEYTSQDQACQFGCTEAGCVGDPCNGIVCNTPPAGGCYQPTGTCSMGICNYATVAGNCDDGNACTTGDACNAGTCVGTPMVCNQPPAADCAAGDVRRVYNAQGTCSAGACQYASTNVACNDSNACTTSDRCENGVCFNTGAPNCNDNNPCTTDACDPISGCTHTPASGPSCVTGSGDCPTGVCSGGACLPIANVTCVAEYDADLCTEVEVPGLCSASGQCVVSQVPPQYQCPGCNGICIRCFVLQFCIPF